MKQIKRILIFLAVLVLLAGCGKKLSLQEYLDLGDKYLTESNYEKAIVAFTKAIELEPKSMKGLLSALEDFPNAAAHLSSLLFFLL